MWQFRWWTSFSCAGRKAPLHQAVWFSKLVGCYDKRLFFFFFFKSRYSAHKIFQPQDTLMQGVKINTFILTLLVKITMAFHVTFFSRKYLNFNINQWKELWWLNALILILIFLLTAESWIWHDYFSCLLKFEVQQIIQCYTYMVRGNSVWHIWILGPSSQNAWRYI